MKLRQIWFSVKSFQKLALLDISMGTMHKLQLWLKGFNEQHQIMTTQYNKLINEIGTIDKNGKKSIRDGSPESVRFGIEFGEYLNTEVDLPLIGMTYAALVAEIERKEKIKLEMGREAPEGISINDGELIEPFFKAEPVKADSNTTNAPDKA
jgi:hypothetical protein